MPELDMRDLDAWALALWPTCGGYMRLGSVTRGLVKNAARHAQDIRAEAWDEGRTDGCADAVRAAYDLPGTTRTPNPYREARP